MVKLGNFTVEIIQKGADGKDVSAKEHEDREAEDPEDETTKYVEIEEDKSFSIKVLIDEDFELEGHDALCVSMTIDGQHEDGMVYQETGLSIGQQTVKIIEGFRRIEQDRQVLQLFRFEETTTRPRDAVEIVEDLQEQFKHQGSIRLKFARVSGYTRPARADPVPRFGSVKFPKDIVKEKGSTSRATFDTAMTRIAKYGHFVTTCREPSVATFRLKYWTIESLWDQEIVARPTRIISDTVIVIPDDQDELDLRAKLERMARAHEAEVRELRQQIKLEKAEAFRESLERKRKILSTNEIGEIDLTEERSAHRRKPNADDVVIELDDQMLLVGAKK